LRRAEERTTELNTLSDGREASRGLFAFVRFEPHRTLRSIRSTMDICLDKKGDGGCLRVGVICTADLIVCSGAHVLDAGFRMLDAPATVIPVF